MTAMLASSSSETSEAPPLRVVIEAYACDGDGDGPGWAEIDNPLLLLAQLRRLQEVVKTNALAEAQIYSANFAWGPAGVDDDLSLDGARLVVAGDSFWFSAYPKHADYHVESRMQDINLFEQMVRQAIEDKTPIVCLGGNPAGLLERVHDDDGLPAVAGADENSPKEVG